MCHVQRNYSLAPRLISAIMGSSTLCIPSSGLASPPTQTIPAPLTSDATVEDLLDCANAQTDTSRAIQYYRRALFVLSKEHRSSDVALHIRRSLERAEERRERGGTEASVQRTARPTLPPHCVELPRPEAPTVVESDESFAAHRVADETSGQEPVADVEADVTPKQVQPSEVAQSSIGGLDDPATNNEHPGSLVLALGIASIGAGTALMSFSRGIPSRTIALRATSSSGNSVTYRGPRIRASALLATGSLLLGVGAGVALHSIIKLSKKRRSPSISSRRISPALGRSHVAIRLSGQF